MVDPASPVTGVKPIRIFILDDHELVRRGLTDLLTATDDLIVVGEAATAGEALRRIPAAAPDVALLDARMPDGSGIDVCREIRSSLENIRCLILTSYDDDEALFAAVMAGASGYLLKQIGGNSLVDGIRQVAAGRSSRFARSDECRCFSTRTVDRSWWSIARRRRHHRLRTPLGYVGLAHVTGIPRKLSGPPCLAVFHRSVVAPVPDKCQALPRTRRPRSAEGFGNRLRSTSASSGKNESAVALGICVASSCRHGRSPFALGRFGWRDRASVARWVAARYQPGGRPPHSNVGDQLGRHMSVRLGSPGRRFSFGVEADLVGELGDYM
jgi:DNA-binding NarL/FixJ family response regulator